MNDVDDVDIMCSHPANNKLTSLYSVTCLFENIPLFSLHICLANML